MSLFCYWLLSSRVSTNNIDQVDYSSIDTPISYSYTSEGVVKISLLGDVSGSYRGRMIDYIGVLSKF